MILHIIRFNIKDRWETGVQKIKITYSAFEDMKWPLILIDGVPIRAKKIETLAINAGFDSVDEFLAWFKTDFEGKIIHFTDLRY